MIAYLTTPVFSCKQARTHVDLYVVVLCCLNNSSTSSSVACSSSRQTLLYFNHRVSTVFFSDYHEKNIRSVREYLHHQNLIIIASSSRFNTKAITMLAKVIVTNIIYFIFGGIRRTLIKSAWIHPLLYTFSWHLRMYN